MIFVFLPVSIYAESNTALKFTFDQNYEATGTHKHGRTEAQYIQMVPSPDGHAARITRLNRGDHDQPRLTAMATMPEFMADKYTLTIKFRPSSIKPKGGYLLDLGGHLTVQYGVTGRIIVTDRFRGENLVSAKPVSTKEYTTLTVAANKRQMIMMVNGKLANHIKLNKEPEQRSGSNGTTPVIIGNVVAGVAQNIFSGDIDLLELKNDYLPLGRVVKPAGKKPVKPARPLKPGKINKPSKISPFKAK